jgi:hypothetical protein
MPRLSHLYLSEFENMKKLPEWLLHLPCLSELVLDFSNDVTIERLRRKGCKVRD